MISKQPKKVLGNEYFFFSCQFGAECGIQSIMKKFGIFSFGLVFGLSAVSGARAAEDLRIAVVAPENSGREHEVVIGLEKALKDLNAYTSYNVSIRSYPETCRAEEDRRAAARIAEEKPAFVIGYVCAYSAMAAQQEYAARGIPYFALSIVAPSLTSRKNENVVRLCPRTDRQFADFAEMLKQRYPGRRFILLDDTTADGGKFLDVLEESLNSTRVRRLKAPLKQANKNVNMLSQQSDFKADFIIIGTVKPDEAVRLISRVREAGIKTPVIGLDVLGTPDFSRMIGSMKEGIYYYAFEDRRHSFDAAGLIAEMRFSGVEPTQAAIASYAAAQIWWQSRRNSGEGESTLHDRTYETVMGSVSIDGGGDIRDGLPGVLYRWEGNTPVPVY